MEIQRRLAAGRLAEVMGEKALPTDKFMRTLGIYRLAEQESTALRPDVRKAGRAYAAGVNAYIAHHTAPALGVPVAAPDPGAVDAGRQPGVGTPDGAATGRQLVRRTAAQPSCSRPCPPTRSTTCGSPMSPPIPPPSDWTRVFSVTCWPPFPTRSNRNSPPTFGWFPANTAETGKPILANDPHLGFQAPILWYLAAISAPGLEVAGGTVPGVPFHLLGHNRRIAWGLTTTQSDTMDLFIERPLGDGYLTPDGPAPFSLRTEVIKVRRGPDVTITVRETRHGPVISDVLGDRADGQLLALSAAALQPNDLTAQAIYRLNRANDWQEFNEALEDFHAPQQNIAFADVDGHIGLVSPGRVPIRKAGDGTLPRPGWTGDYDWTGWVPFDALPRVFDPPSGIIVNANNQVVADSYPYLLAVTWPDAYRAQRILERLGERPRHSVENMTALQMDELSLMAVEMKPLLMRTPSRGPRAAAVYDMLSQWNQVTDAHRAEPLIFEAWLTHLQRRLLKPWLGPQANSFGGLKPLFLKAVLQGRTIWCAGPGEPIPNSCDKAVADALDSALDDLGKRFGDNMADWRWGDAHVAMFDALLFRYIPVLDNMTRLAVGTGGDDFTIQRGGFFDADPSGFRHVHGAGLRAVYDLSDLDGSRFMIATGQSGSPVSAHWGDMLELWRDGATITLPPRHHLASVLELEPMDR